MLLNSEWGPVAYHHPLDEILEAEIWWKGKGVFIQKLSDFGTRASTFISHLPAHNSMCSGVIQLLSHSVPIPDCLPLPWATSFYGPSLLLLVIWSDFWGIKSISCIGWSTRHISLLTRTTTSSWFNISEISQPQIQNTDYISPHMGNIFVCFFRSFG